MVGTGNPEIPSKGLRRNYLSNFEILGQSIGGIAPSATPGLVVMLLFATSGNGTWLVLAFATIALLFLSDQIRVFASRMASPGALYVYAADGLGPLVGVITGWSLVIAYYFAMIDTVAGIINELVILLQNLGVATGMGTVLILGVLIYGLASILVYRDIKLSTRIATFVELFTMLLVLGLIGAFFIHQGHVVDTDQLTLKGMTLGQLRPGLVLAFFSFAGFETAAALGAEARNPLKSVAPMIFASVLLSGVFFMVTTYGLVDAFKDVTPALDKQDSPLTTLSQSLGAGTIGIFIPLGIACSLFAAMIASLNAGSRIIYTFSHRGVFHSAAQKTHATHATPHVALIILSIGALITLVAMVVLKISPVDIFGYTGTLFTFGLIFAYIAVALGAPVYLKKRGELKAWNVISAAITIILLIIALLGNVYPVPDFPSNILPYIFLGLLSLGTAYFFYIRKVDPVRLTEVEEELLGIEHVDSSG